MVSGVDCSIQRGGGVGVGAVSWLVENIKRKMGYGSSTLFWRDHWVEGTLISDMLSRLYGLAENKIETVAKLFTLGWGVNVEVWKW